MTISPIFAWYDLWIGAYWDRKAHRLYVLPLPCIGFVISFGKAIVAAIDAKQTKNEARKWPDWRTQPTDKAIEHDRNVP